jgi:hypothetical protein
MLHRHAPAFAATDPYGHRLFQSIKARTAATSETLTMSDSRPHHVFMGHGRCVRAMSAILPLLSRETRAARIERFRRRTNEG